MPALCLPSVLLVLSFPSEAHAAGPFFHLWFAQHTWSLAQSMLGLSAQPGVLEAMLAGSVAPDAGYYPGAVGAVSRLAHHVHPWRLMRGMLALARNDQERAFSAGWISHALLDVRLHGQFIEPAVKGQANPLLAHKSLEWGWDCRLLAREDNAWMWRRPGDPRAGCELWARTMSTQHDRPVDANLLESGQRAQYVFIALLPRVFWLSGRLERPDRPLANRRARRWGKPLATWLASRLARYRWGLDPAAILHPTDPKPVQRRSIWWLAGLATQDMARALRHNQWPHDELAAAEAPATHLARDGWLSQVRPRKNS